jgi:1-phosphatidylinositol-4-phosphate 5-kinase
VFKAGESTGASGSFFFFSFDNRFIIKTLNRDEREKLFKMLPAFKKHVKDTNNNSLIARIYGVFTFWTNHFAPLDIMIMENTARTKSKNKFAFDLKGSLIKRRVPFEA